MSLLLASEMRLVTGNVHTLHSHVIIHPGGCHSKTCFPLDCHQTRLWNQNNPMPSISFHIILGLSLGKNWKYKWWTQQAYEKKIAMNSLKLLFWDFHWSNPLSRKTILYPLTKLSFCFLSSLQFSPAASLRIVQENINEKERILRVNREAFGDGPQPKLEFAEYKVVKATMIFFLP